MPRSGIAHLVLTAFLAACAAGPQSDGEIRSYVVDGVNFVENPGLHIADASGVRVEAEAALRIGVVEGPAEYMFGRVAGAVRRDNGTLLIADGSANELRVYDAEGRFLRRVGRAGDGPGEFRGIAAMTPLADGGVAVFGSSVSIFDAQLDFVRRFTPRLQATRARPPFTSHRVVDVFPDGTLLMQDYIRGCAEDTQGLCVDSVAFYRTDHEGATLAEFGTFVYDRVERYSVMPGFGVAWREPHPQAFWQLLGDRFHYADAQRFEVQVYDAGGNLERRIRVAAPPPSWARDDLFVPPTGEPPDERAAEARRVLVERMQRAAVPDTLPHFSDMIVAADGSVWLREFVPASLRGERKPRWFVLDSDGRLRWSVQPDVPLQRGAATASRPRPISIGQDGVLLVHRDELGVESVALHPLRVDGR